MKALPVWALNGGCMQGLCHLNYAVLGSLTRYQ